MEIKQITLTTIAIVILMIGAPASAKCIGKGLVHTVQIMMNVMTNSSNAYITYPHFHQINIMERFGFAKVPEKCLDVRLS